MRFSPDEMFDIGEDSGSPVTNNYASPNRFTGTLKKVVVEVQPATLTVAERQKASNTLRAIRLGME